MDDADQRCTISKKENTPHTFKAVADNWGDYIEHADLWGPKAKYILKNDTLKIRAEIQYASVKQTELKDSGEPLKKKLCAVQGSKVGKDFELISSEGTRFFVHRAILSASSPVFSSMLQSGMKEAKSGRYTMSDVSRRTLSLMIKYMYENSTDLLDETPTIKDVLIAADEYQMADLKEVCQKLLVADLTDGNATGLLMLADKISATILKTAALIHVAENLQAMTNSGQLGELTETGDRTLLQEAFAAVARHGAEVVGSAKKVAGRSKKRKTSD